MSGKRQKTEHKQLCLAFAQEGRGEAPAAGGKGSEPRTAKRPPESPALEERLMEEVCDRDNLEIAWKRVRGKRLTNCLLEAWSRRRSRVDIGGTHDVHSHTPSPQNPPHA